MTDCSCNVGHISIRSNFYRLNEEFITTSRIWWRIFSHGLEQHFGQASVSKFHKKGLHSHTLYLNLATSFNSSWIGANTVSRHCLVFHYSNLDWPRTVWEQWFSPGNPMSLCDPEFLNEVQRLTLNAIGSVPGFRRRRSWVTSWVNGPVTD